jgi:PDZ domain-containing secreted protein
MAGADVFFVPDSQSEEDLAEARRVLGKSVRIVTVASVEEALQVLEDLGGSGLENATIDL